MLPSPWERMKRLRRRSHHSLLVGIASDASTRQRPSHAPDAFLEAVGRDKRCRRLEAGMDPAVLAAGIVAWPVLLPFDPFEQGVVGRKDPVRQQVARPLPPIRIARDRSPRCTGKLAFAGEEFLIDRAREPAVAV